MASTSDGQNVSQQNRAMERLFEDAQNTGDLNLSGRQLKEYPPMVAKYDMADTTAVDLSKNRLNEVPQEVCKYASLEKLQLYQNVLKQLPTAICQLQNLVQLNISRNQLSILPLVLCRLRALEVLHASHNRLVSLPEEIGELENLMDLDVSCNEISHLPVQIGDLSLLRSVDLRRNMLVELPVDIARLRLQHLDLRANRITAVPSDLRHMETLEELRLEHNPLTTPPAHLCTRGRVHVMKFLQQEAVREERKRGALSAQENTGEVRRRVPPLHSSTSGEELRLADSPGGERRKRNTLDSGYSTTDSCTARWSPVEDVSHVNGHSSPLKHCSAHDRSNATASRHHDVTRSDPLEGYSPAVVTSEKGELIDEFTRELQRQRSEYDMKKRAAEQLRLQVESTSVEERKTTNDNEFIDEESQERRRAAARLQEEQNAILNRARNERKLLSNSEPRPAPPLPPQSSSHSTLPHEASDSRCHRSFDSFKPVVQEPSRKSGSSVMLSNGKQPLKTSQEGGFSASAGRRSVSDYTISERAVPPQSLDSSQNHNYGYQGSNPPLQSPENLSETHELLQRHGAMVMQQRHEAQVARRRVQQESARVLQQPPINGDAQPKVLTPESGNVTVLPPRAAKALQEMGSTLDSLNPGFTVRRHLERLEDEREQQRRLRATIESRLKIILPDDLGLALRDGVVLCHLANHVRPRSVPSIHVPSPAAPKLTTAKCKRNVENFLHACSRIGVNAQRLCTASDVLEYEQNSVTSLALTVDALLAFTLNKQSRV